MPRITQAELSQKIYKQMDEIQELGYEIEALGWDNVKLEEEIKKLKKEKDEIIEEYECYKSTTDSTIGELQGEIEELKTGEPVI